MELNLTSAQFYVLKELLSLVSITGLSTKKEVSIEGWHGKGKATFNRLEYEGKVHITIQEVTND